MTAYNIIDIIFSVAVTAIGIVGLTFNSSIIKKGIRSEIFIYYTNLSNIAVIIFQICLLVSYAVPESSFYELLTSPWLRLSVAMMILLTCVVYHFLLRAEIKKNGAERKSAEKSIGNLCVHYIVPLLTFVQWAWSADKKGLLVTDGLIWLVCPATYAAFVAVRGRNIDMKTKSGNDVAADGEKVKYPYGFLNIDLLGGARVAANIAIVGIACAASGCLAAFAAILLSA